MSPTPSVSSYAQACADHHWRVPERYNIAADVCDRHPRDGDDGIRHRVADSQAKVLVTNRPTPTASSARWCSRC